MGKGNMSKTDNNLAILTVLFVVSLVISNVVTAKLFYTGVPLWGEVVVLPGAVVCYALTFLCTDIIGEIWGKAAASRAVVYGFIGQVAASLMILFTQMLPTVSPELQAAYDTLLGQNHIFVFGSLVAYFASQLWDVYIFHAIRERWLSRRGTTSARWIWNNVSTMTSQLIDTVLFAGISFGIGFGWLFDPHMRGALLSMMAGQYVFKFLLAALDTPFFMFFTRGTEALS